MPLGSVMIYAKDVEATAAFYETHFGFQAHRRPNDRLVVLVHPEGGAGLTVHPAAKSQRMGQVLVKLVFDVEDIEDFCRRSAEKGLVFGSIHEGDGYQFANAKDPGKNPVCVSSRAFRRTA